MESAYMFTTEIQANMCKVEYYLKIKIICWENGWTRVHVELTKPER